MLRRRMAAGDHLRRNQAPLRHRGAGTDLQTLPDGQLTQRLKLTRAAADKLGHQDRFSKVPLAVSFSEDWHYGLEDAFESQAFETFRQRSGSAAGHVHSSRPLRHRM